VEKAMKEALKNDRARIQVGRISSFGLMEMSRQRLRTGVLEASTRQCPHCEGTGLVRTASSAGLSALRLIEDEAARGRGSLLTLRASQEAAVYVLNRKRAELAEIEDRYGVRVEVMPDGEDEGARMSVEASGPPPAYAPKFEAIVDEFEDDIPEDIEDEADEPEQNEETDAPRVRDREERPEGEDGGRRRRRRRGRRGRNREEGEDMPTGEGEAGETGEPRESGDEDADDEPREATSVEGASEGGERGEGGRRRRGRRGRRGGRRPEGEARDAGDAGPVNDLGAPIDEAPMGADQVPVDAPVEEAPKKTRRRPRARAGADAAPVEAPAEKAPSSRPVADKVEPAPEPVAEKPKRARRAKAAVAAEPEAVVEAPAAAPADEPQPKKRAPRRKAGSAAEQAPGAVAVDKDGAAPADDAVAGGIDPDPGEAGSARRGWWQRTFGQ
ncbi:MAG: ribonuclease E/G, partial [Sphingomonas sp.]